MKQSLSRVFQTFIKKKVKKKKFIVVSFDYDPEEKELCTFVIIIRVCIES